MSVPMNTITISVPENEPDKTEAAIHALKQKFPDTEVKVENSSDGRYRILKCHTVTLNPRNPNQDNPTQELAKISHAHEVLHMALRLFDREH